MILLFDVLGKLNVSSAVGDVTGSSVKVNYSISPRLLEASDLTFNIQYNSTTSVMESSNDFTALNGSVTLTGLTPNTEYLFWVTAKASDGITVTSEIMDFKTLLVGKSISWWNLLVWLFHVE